MSYRSMTFLVCASQLCFALGVFARMSDLAPRIALEDIDDYDLEDKNLESKSTVANLLDSMKNYIMEKNINNHRLLYNGENPPGRFPSLSDSILDTETFQSQVSLMQKRNDRRRKGCYLKHKFNSNLLKACLKHVRG